MPEYSITTTGNFYHSRLEIIFFVIDYDPEIVLGVTPRLTSS